MQRTSTPAQMFLETSYADRILELAVMSTCKDAPTPGTDPLKRGAAELAEPLSPEAHRQYRKLVGQLLWLSNLRGDITYAIKELSRGLASPTTDHWAKLKHLLRYLSGTKDYVQELCPKLRRPSHFPAARLSFTRLVLVRRIHFSSGRCCLRLA